MESCFYVYDPTDKQAKFVVYFDQDSKQMQHDHAQRVIVHLNTLSKDSLAQESIEFFKWIVLHKLGCDSTHYAQLLLDYFHEHELLTCKKTIDNPVKQMKARYLVVFTMGNQTFARTYNSIRELKVDTGKRPCQIQRKSTNEIVCSSVT
jgi:hypothetical protein